MTIEASSPSSGGLYASQEAVPVRHCRDRVVTDGEHEEVGRRGASVGGERHSRHEYTLGDEHVGWCC